MRVLIATGAALVVSGAGLLAFAGGDESAPRQAAAAEIEPRGFTPLGDEEAAKRVDPAPIEIRPENARANVRVPTDAELVRYRAERRRGEPMCFDDRDLRVTGRFAGTTDEILQWAAHKWGLEPDVVRAVAVIESTWRQAFVGDAGQSFGLMQVKRTVHQGTFPLARDSTAFNVDYFAAMVRSYLDGCAPWLNAVERGAEYRRDDLWGSIGAWFAGRWRTPEALEYIGSVQRVLADRRWREPDFAD